MKKLIISSLSLASLLATNIDSIQADQNFISVRVEKSEYMKNGVAPTIQALAPLILGKAYLNLINDFAKDFRASSASRAMSLLQDRAKLISFANSFDGDIKQLEKNINSLDKTEELIKSANESETIKVKAPLSTHRDIIVARIERLVASQSGIKNLDEFPLQHRAYFTNKLVNGEVIGNEIENTKLQRKIQVLQADYNNIVLESKTNEYGLVEREIKKSNIEKSIRSKVYLSLESERELFEKGKDGKTALQKEISLVESRLKRVQSDLNEVRETRKSFAKTGKYVKNGFKLVAFSALASGAYLTLEVADKYIEIEILENGDTKLIDAELIIE